jgi:hypothetical protein
MEIQLNSKLNKIELFLKIQIVELEIFGSEFSMNILVIRSSLAKFHKFLRSPSILNKFQLNSTHTSFSGF